MAPHESRPGGGERRGDRGGGMKSTERAMPWIASGFINRVDCKDHDARKRGKDDRRGERNTRDPMQKSPRE